MSFIIMNGRIGVSHVVPKKILFGVSFLYTSSFQLTHLPNSQPTLPHPFRMRTVKDTEDSQHAKLSLLLLPSHLRHTKPLVPPLDLEVGQVLVCLDAQLNWKDHKVERYILYHKLMASDEGALVAMMCGRDEE